MKREFLQSLTMGDQPLSKEIIDTIMAENGRDIQNVRSQFADYEQLKEKLAQAEGYEAAVQAAKEWEEKFHQAAAQHQQAMEELEFQKNLELAIFHAQGRNAKAITALLDVDALKSCENQQTALAEAMQTLKRDCSYLFRTETPPPYARGTGAAAPDVHKSPATLAGALLERFERK